MNLNKKSIVDISLDENKVHAYCQRYKYNYKMHQDNRIAIIETATDSWRITADVSYFKGEILPRMEVGHYNKSGNKKGKMQYHIQKHAKDIDYVFTNIISTHISKKGTLDGIFDLKSMYEDLKIKHA